jgi:polyisoprenoid-binding protein YceI
MKLLTVLLFTLGSAWAQKKVWTLDASHSSINFAIDHMVISETTGIFKDYTVDVKSDKPDFTDAQFKVVLKVASIDTRDVKRDDHLKNADFFDTAKFPDITFVGKKFEKQKNGTYKVHGTLTMKGVSKDVILDGKFGGIIKDPWGNTKAGLKVWGPLDRYDWGLKYNSAIETGGLAIGQEVRLTAHLELTKSN